MWHVSTAFQQRHYDRRELLAFAYEALGTLGDGDLGEWVEYGASAVHIRRRLSPEEEALVGPVLDIRGTPEHATRAWAVAKLLPKFYRSMVMEADA